MRPEVAAISPLALCSAALVAALAVLQPAAPAAPSAWVSDPGVQRRLAAGEVVVQAVTGGDPERQRGTVRAAVRIGAPADTIWKIMTDCQQAQAFVPGLKRCLRVGGAADGSWADIEHEVRYSWMLPTVDYVFRAHYDRPHRIDFRRVSGDLKEEEGAWQLVPAPDASATIVEYEVYLDPGFWIPHFLVTRSLRKDLPAALAGLRERAERAESGH